MKPAPLNKGRTQKLSRADYCKNVNNPTPFSSLDQ